MVAKEKKVAIIQTKIDQLKEREFSLEVEIEVYQKIGNVEIGDDMVKQLTYIKKAIKGFEEKLAELK